MVGEASILAEHFGVNLRVLRRRGRQSQDYLASRAGLHRTEISLLELGRRVPRLDTIVKLSGGLEIESGALLDGLEWLPGSSGHPGAFGVRTPEPPRQRRGREDS